MPNLTAEQKTKVASSIRDQYKTAASAGKFVPPSVARAKALDRALHGKKRRKTTNLKRARAAAAKRK